ncbi:MAG: indole-3-glycerol phosphate synthase TrpC [Prevotella sp.]|nr:indole-3-glycerol phosphate synthase TrpC [Prevotella sp.]
MKDVLQEIVAHKRVELVQFKEQLPERMIHQLVERYVEEHPEVPSMRQSLLSSSSGIIAEFKRRSPSKGWIKEEGRADVIPLSYQENGAAALSILTDEQYFGGKDEFISIARRSGVTIPVLYKNFVVDEYQLFQARLCGASAVLLIAADLSKKECADLLRLAHELGLEVLLEMHSEAETEYAELKPDMCGINNRNLGTFITDVRNSFRLASFLPAEACKVSESGISSPHVVADLRMAGFNGFLVGENFMKTEDPGAALRGFISEIEMAIKRDINSSNI